MPDTPADWYPDPLGRHEYRYWDGAQWTEHVADAGQAGTDPISSPRQPGPEEDSATDVERADDVDDGGVVDRGPVGQQAGVPVPDEPAVGAGDIGGSGAGAFPGGTGGAAPIAASGGGGRGIRSSLFDDAYREQPSDERVALQNRKMLKVVLGPEVLARQGSMVAFQGSVEFDYEGSGGVSRFIKKAVTGEGVPLMRCSGNGEVFLAHDGDDVHLLWLDGGGVTVNGRNILAFDPALSWDIQRVQGASMFAGGLFNTVLRGTGWVAITTHGTPVALRTDAPTYADTDAAVAWSSDLQTSLNRTFKASSMIGRGSGELAQLAFSGDGFVIVQASEGPAVPDHNHGS